MGPRKLFCLLAAFLVLFINFSSASFQLPPEQAFKQSLEAECYGNETRINVSESLGGEAVYEGELVDQVNCSNIQNYMPSQEFVENYDSEEEILPIWILIPASIPVFIFLYYSRKKRDYSVTESSIYFISTLILVSTGFLVGSIYQVSPLISSVLGFLLSLVIVLWRNEWDLEKAWLNIGVCVYALAYIGFTIYLLSQNTLG